MNELTSYALSHQEFVYGIVVGWAATHPRIIVRFLFNSAMKIPFVDSLVKKHGPELRAWVKEGSDELIEDIDKADGPDPEKPKP